MHITSKLCGIIKGNWRVYKILPYRSNLTQGEVTEKVDISLSTLSMAECGENIVLANLLKILRVLNTLYVLEKFKISEPSSPLQLAREDEKKRRRSSRNHN